MLDSVTSYQGRFVDGKLDPALHRVVDDVLSIIQSMKVPAREISLSRSSRASNLISQHYYFVIEMYCDVLLDMMY